MKKLILSLACASTIIGAVVESSEKVRLDNKVKIHLATELASLDNKIERLSTINSCFIGFFTGLATGGGCALVDHFTKDNIWILTWGGVSTLRPIILSSWFESFKTPHLSLKEKSKLKKRKNAASIVAMITAWAMYIIIKNGLKPAKAV